MAALIPILLRLLPYIIGAALLVSGWLYADRACWSTACKSERTQVGALRTQIEYAQKRATDLALLWAKQVEATDEAVRKERLERNQQFAALAARAAKGLGTTPDLRLSERGSGLLLDASRLANATPAPAGIEAPPDPVPRSAGISEAELEQKWREAAEAYADVDALRRKLIDYYEGLANGQDSGIH